MALRTIKLEGTLTNEQETIFEYPIGDVLSITSGRWQFAVSSLSIFFKNQQDLHPFNANYELSSNFIDTVIPEETGKVRAQMPLAIVRIKGNPGEKIVIGFKWRDYFEATCPRRLLQLKWKELNPYQVAPALKREAYVYVVLLFRRIE